MVGKKKLALILSGLLVMTGLMSCSSNNSSEKGENATKASESINEDGKTYTIGINQLVQHDALDASREGFIEGLKEKGFEEGKNLKINYQNAQGDMAIAKTISDQFVTSNVDLIFAIATSSLQASYNSTKDIPIVFTAVTDPIDAGVAKSWESSGTNVTGTSDMVSMEKQLELAKEAVSLIKEFRRLATIIGDNIFKSVKSNKDGSKIIINHAYEGRLVYNLNEIHNALEDEMEGFAPCGGGLDEAVDLAVDEFECEYRNKDKKEFMKYVGKVYYMKFRCEEIYERLKEIEEEVSEIM